MQACHRRGGARELTFQLISLWEAVRPTSRSSSTNSRRTSVPPCLLLCVGGLQQRSAAQVRRSQHTFYQLNLPKSGLCGCGEA